jgi:hypothetical protein
MRPLFRKPDASSRDIERELISQRPEAPRAFVRALAADVRGREQASRFGRLGVAVAFSGLVLIAMASFGGVGYAFSAASQAVRKIETIVHATKPSTARHPSAAQDQYTPALPPLTPPTTPPTKTPPAGKFTPPTSGKKTPKTTAFKPPKGPKGRTGKGTLGTSVTQRKGTGGLPFTGLALWIPMAGGLVLLLLGFALRRAGRSREQT